LTALPIEGNFPTDFEKVESAPPIFGGDLPFRSYALEMRRIFGGPVQKLSVNAGLTCPNRDGSLDTRGCSYCDNEAFTPAYCRPHRSVDEQLRKGMDFFRTRRPDVRYLAYFQTYSNTYAQLPELKRLYNEALAAPGIAGLLIGTRPDCVDEAVLDIIGELGSGVFVGLEYGVESTLDRSLERINRHCTYETAVKAIQMTRQRGLHCGVHLILGLPGESREDLLGHADVLSGLPIHSLKLHQLQIVRGTALDREYTDNPDAMHLFSQEEYIELVIQFLERLNPAIALDRLVGQVPPSLLVAPHWGAKNQEIVSRITKAMKSRNTWQGRCRLQEA
jgi:uncharacterized protein